MLLKAQLIQTVTIACFLQAALSLPVSSDHALVDRDTPPLVTFSHPNSQPNTAHSASDISGQIFHRSLDFIGQPELMIRDRFYARSPTDRANDLSIQALTTPTRQRGDSVISPSPAPPPDTQIARQPNRISLLLFKHETDELQKYIDSHPHDISPDLQNQWVAYQEEKEAFKNNSLVPNFCANAKVLLSKLKLLAKDLVAAEGDEFELMLGHILSHSPDAQELMGLVNGATTKEHHKLDCQDNGEGRMTLDLGIAYHQTKELYLRRKVVGSSQRMMGREWLLRVIPNQQRYAQAILGCSDSVEQEKTAATKYLDLLNGITVPEEPETSGGSERGSRGTPSRKRPRDREEFTGEDTITANTGPELRSHHKQVRTG
ncbi:hypothetical protein H0H93_016905 [Arthromyces matolae]|nr:hypothetical protein H0H93_016905 [Arthromyces matolae]